MVLKEPISFPAGFLWGSATSSFQVEGACKEGGKGLSVLDINHDNPNICDFSIASDHYHRWREDIAYMAEMGLKAYRFSVAWTRILPSGRGQVNEAGIKFYGDIISELKKNNIEPILTMYHFDYPQGLVEEYGGWFSERSIKDFVNYAKVLFQSYGADVKYWLTINEQDHVFRINRRLGVKDKDTGRNAKERYQACHHMCVAHAKAVALCREMVKDAQIGPAASVNYIYPASCDPLDAVAAKDAMLLQNYYLLDLYCRGEYSAAYLRYLTDRGWAPTIRDGDMEIMKKNPPDFIAFNYYATQTVEYFPIDEENPFGKVFAEKLPRAEAGIYKIVPNKNLKSTRWRWEIDEIGFRLTMRDIYDRYGLPLMVTENGFGGYDQLDDHGEIEDKERIDYLKNHISQMKYAIAEGVPLLAYCTWSFIDLISGHDGTDKRYGFVYVNRDNFDLKDLSRRKKKSFSWYQKVIKTNGEIL